MRAAPRRRGGGGPGSRGPSRSKRGEVPAGARPRPCSRARVAAWAGSPARSRASCGSASRSKSSGGSASQSGELAAAVAQRDHRRDRALGGVFHRHRAAARSPAATREQALAVAGRDRRGRAPASSASVGRTSRAETGASMPARRRGRARRSSAAPAAEPSRKLILNQRPRSPSMSPWSERKRTTVSSAMPPRVEDAEDLADLLVDVADVGEVGAARAADVLGGDREGGVVAGAHQPLAMRVLAVEGDRRRPRGRGPGSRRRDPRSAGGRRRGRAGG